MTDNPSLRKAIYVLKAPIVRKIGLKIRHFRCLDKFALQRLLLHLQRTLCYNVFVKFVTRNFSHP